MMHFWGWTPKSNDDRRKKSKSIIHPENVKINGDYIRVPPGVKPIRIILLLLTLVLFAFVVYMTAMESSPLTDASSILLIVLTSIYVFTLIMDVISQFGGTGIPDSPMLVFSILGVLLFATAGLVIIFHVYGQSNHWALVASFVLCLAIALLFLIELFLILFHWRRKCDSATKCYPCVAAHTCGAGQLRTFFQQDYDNRPIGSDISKYDATTSVSSCRQAPAIEDTMNPIDICHAYRKIENVRRRQYVDGQSSMPSIAAVEIAQVQTDQKNLFNTEIQTQEVEKCIACTCHRKPCTPIYPHCLRPAACAPCAIYPTIMHLLHSDLNSACCNDCRCGGAIEVHQEELQRQEDPANPATPASHTNLIVEECISRQSRKIPRVYETRPCPTHGSGLAAILAGLPDTVTKVTLPDCYVRRNKRTQTPKQCVSNKHDKSGKIEESHKEQQIKKNSNAVIADVKSATDVKTEKRISETAEQLSAEKTAQEKSVDKDNSRDTESGTICQRSEGSSSRECTAKRNSKIFQKKNKVDLVKSEDATEKNFVKTCGCALKTHQTWNEYCAMCGNPQATTTSRSESKSDDD